MLYLTTSPKLQYQKIGCGLDKLQWTDVFKIIQDTFTYSGVQIQIITRRETDSIRLNPSSSNKHYIENEGENSTNEWTREPEELEIYFTRDSKPSQPPCSEQFPTLKPKQFNDVLIEYNLQYQSKDIRDFIIQFDFR